MADTSARDPAAIRAGIERAQQEIERSMAELRQGVAATFEWRSIVRRHTAACLGGAAVAGLLLARWTSR
jgi:hypothetical protein